MTLSLVFNPFTGTFDYVPDTSAFAAAVPLIIAAGVTYEPPVGQTFFKLPILNAGTIRLDAGAVLAS